MSDFVRRTPTPMSYTALKTRIDTRDLAAAVAFYEDVLGLIVVDRWDDEGDRGAILGLGGPETTAFLELGEVADARPSGVSVQLRVADLDGWVEALGERWAFEGPVERPWGSRYVYLTDPAGVRVIVFEGEV